MLFSITLLMYKLCQKFVHGQSDMKNANSGKKERKRKMIVGHLKRCLAGFLAMAIVLTSSNIAYAAESLTKDKLNPVWETTDAAIIADNYGFSDEEKAVLSYDVIKKGNSLSVNSIPTTEDGLVKVDTVDNSVHAESKDGWIPTKVEAVDTNGNVLGNATFDPSGDAILTGVTASSYTANVTYVYNVKISTYEQARMIKIPEYLADGMDYLDALKAVKDPYEMATEAMPELAPVLLKDVEALYNHSVAYNDLPDGNKLGYLAKYSVEETGIRAVAETALTALNNVVNNPSITEDILDYLNPLIANVTTLAGDCDLATYKADVFTNEEYPENNEAFEKAVWALADVEDGLVSEKTDVSNLTSTITAATTVVTASVASATVTVSVQIQVAPEEALVAPTFDDLETVTSNDYKLKFTVDLKGADKIADTISEIEQQLLYGNEEEDGAYEAWAVYGLDEALTNYEATRTDVPAFDSLEEGKTYNYVLTFIPKEVEVTNNYLNVEAVPYGSKIKLPTAGEGKYYDYVVTVDGASTYYNEGSELKVVAPMDIQRGDAAEKTVTSLLKLLAEEQNTLSGNSFSQNVYDTILTSEAVYSPIVSVREPDDKMVADVQWDEENDCYYTVAPAIESGMEGMTWVAKDVVLVNEATELNVKVKQDAKDPTRFTWNYDGDYSHIKVEYQLKVTKYLENDGSGNYAELTTDIVYKYLNLPAKVVADAKLQLEVLDYAKRVYDAIEGDAEVKAIMSTTALSLMKKHLSADGQAAIEAILADEGSNAQLSFYTYLCELKAAEGDKEVWNNLINYYTGEYHTKLDAKAEVLADNLAVLAKPEEKDGLKKAINAFSTKEVDIDSVQSQISEFVTKLNNLRDKIEDPYDEILVGNTPEFAALISGVQTLIANNEQIPTFESGFDVYAIAYATADAQGWGSYKVVVKGLNGAKAEVKVPYKYASEETEGKHIVTAEDVTNIKNAIAQAEEKLGITSETKKYYDLATEAAIPKAGATATVAASTITSVYVPKTYSVPLGNTTVEFTGTPTSAVITLEPLENPEAHCVYEYTIAEEGQPVETQIVDKAAGTYVVKNIEALADAAANGSSTIKIERKVVNQKTEEIDHLLTVLNDALAGENLASFIAVKDYENTIADNGVYESIVLKLNISKDVDMKSLAASVAGALQEIGLSTPYIGFGGEDFLYRVDNNINVDPQTLIDVILNSGLSSTGLSAIINSDGTVNNNVVEEENDFGGKLVTSSLQLGESKDEATDIDLFVTLGGANKDYLKQLKSFLTTLNQYGLTFSCSEGKVNFVGNLSENIYNTYVAFMLLMDNGLNLDNIVDADIQDHIKELVAMMDKTLADENLSWETICNTVKALGFDAKAIENHKDIVTKLIDKTQSLYGKYVEKNTDDAKFDNAGHNWFEFNISYDAAGVLSKVNGFNKIEDMLTTTTLSVPFKFQLVNIKDTYVALVVDMGQSGLAKINYTEDLAKALDEAAGFTYVVLLKDIVNTDALVNNQTTILNLNGNQVLVPIQANGSLKIVDSKMASDAGALGNVRGNVTLTAGNYRKDKLPTDITTVIKAPYTYDTYTENGIDYVSVYNQYYTLEEDAEGNLTVVLTTKFADALHENVKDVAVEIATDILFRAYTNASIKVADGNNTYNIYDIEFANLVSYLNNISAGAEAALDGIDEAGITGFVNALIAKFTDFDAIAKTLTSDDLTIAAYDLEKSAWYATSYIDADNKIALGIFSGKDQNDVTKSKLTLKFAEANKELADSFKELDKIVTIDPTFILENISYTAANGFQLNGSAGAKIVMNMLSKDGTASDYVTALSVLLAYNMENGTAKNDFLKAIEYYDGNVYAGYLKETFDTFTVGQLKAALEKAGKAECFAAIIKELGLEGTEVGNHAARLEACYKPLLDAFDEVYTEIVNIVGEEKIDELLSPQYDKTFASLKGTETGHYDAKFENASGKLWFEITLKLFATAADDEEYVDNVQDFLDKFDAIPDYTNDKTTSLKDRASQSADAIREALEAYNKLSEEQKKIVAKQYAELQKLIESYEVKLGVWAEEITGKYIFKGSGHTPAVKVYFGATVLTAGKDYSVSYKYNVNAAKANTKKAPQAIITLKGNYTGKIYKYFTIEKINLSGGAEYLKNVGLTISEVNQAKSKKASYSKPTIKLNGKKVDASNFTFTNPTGTAHKKVGTYTVTITGKGKNFTGSTTVDLNVVTALLKNVTVEKKIKTQKYKDGGVKPGSSKFKLTYKGTTLVEGTHFEIVGYKNYDKAGTATVTLRGLGVEHKDANGLCFAGTLKLNYKIKALGSLKKATLKTTKKTYTGSEITLTGYKVKGSNGKTLVEGKDYKVTYSNNVKAGKATITFTGIGGYTGSVKKTFTIAKKKLSSKYLTEGKDLVVQYTKGGATPTSSIELTYKGKVLKNGTDYTIKWGNNTKVKKATSKKAPYFTITGKGNFKGSFTVKFTIQGTSIENTVISVKDVLYKNKKYNYKPSITVKDTNGKKLKSGTDYKVSYQIFEDGKWQSVSKSDLYKSKRLKLNSKNPEAFLRVKITGKGNYAGAKVYKEFRMYYKSITKATINVGDYKYSRYTSELRETIENNLKVYYGKKLLRVGTDYDYEIVSIKNYENAGEATIKVTGVNTYGGTLSKTFTIKAVKHSPVKLKKSMVAAESKKLVVDYKKDSAAKPSTKDIKLSYVDNNGETVNLVYGRDYTIKWYNTGKVAKSTAKKAPKFKITGKGNFTGSTTVKYTIQKSDVADLAVTAKNKKYKSEEYNYKTKVTVKDVNGKVLVAGKDYKVSYQVKEDGKWVSVSKSDLYKKSGKKIVLKKKMKSLEMRVVVKGKGSYTGKITDEYKLKR